MTYCADHDPLLHAGHVTCGHCGAVSYPVTAEWVAPALVLAAFDQTHQPGCPRRRTAAGTVLIDLDAASPAIPDVQRPRRCRGTTAAGRPCGHSAGRGSGYCHQHDPARQRGGA